MKKILVACDKCCSEVLVGLSEISGIFITTNFKDTITSLSIHDFSIIVADCKMPTMIGLRLLDEMRKGTVKTVPVIGFAHSLYWRDRFIRNGAIECFSVLDDPKKILDKIKEII